MVVPMPLSCVVAVEIEARSLASEIELADSRMTSPGLTGGQALDRQVVDEGAVARAEVLDQELVVAARQPRVVAREEGVRRGQGPRSTSGRR